MKISLNLLKTLIDCDWPYDKIAQRLTMSGSEVESIELRGHEVAGVISARVDSVSKVKGSDKLTLCEIFTGSETLQVICGAPNVASGQNVIFAPIGSKLKGGVKIAKAKIHGIESSGMILSEAELDISPESEIISILPSDIKPGTPLEKIINYKDVVYELEITPNRPDCLSHLGIARELQALGGGKVHFPDIAINEIDEPLSNYLAIAIDEPAGCPRYTGRVVRDVAIGQSPLWLKMMMHYLGMRPINNVVDISNFVMMELGQPLHAFDFHRLGNPRIVVRRAGKGEKFKTLDNVERALNEGHLLITDGVEAVAIAGIMGGLLSEVIDKTNAVLLESAYFDPVTVRRGSKSLGLSTESSRRFERGIDPNLAPLANNRACKLMSDLCGGHILKGIIDCHPRPFEPVTIELRSSRVERLLGTKIGNEDIKRILDGLEIKYSVDGNFKILQPSFRPDLTREVDLIEEVARIYGFDNIPASFRPGGSLITAETRLLRVREKTRAYLVGAGLLEIFPITLGDTGMAVRLGRIETSVRLMNPLSEEMAIVRPDLLLTMLPIIRRNLNFRERNLALFEIGDVYYSSGKGQLPTQAAHLGIALCGMEFPDFWGTKWRTRDLYTLKGLIEDMASHLQLGEIELSPCDYFAFEKGYSFVVNIGRKSVGWMGWLSRGASDAADIKEPVFIAELDFDKMVEMVPDAISARELARFPSADRDIAIVLDDGIPAGSVKNEIAKAGEGIIDEIWVFDLYKGKNIPQGKKSLAFGMKFRHTERTLTDEEVNRALDNIVSILKDKFGAELRT